MMSDVNRYRLRGKGVGFVDDSPARSSTSKLARSTIMRLGKEAVPELIAKVSDPDTRADVVDLLGAMGPDADDAVPLLTSLQQDPDIGEAAIQALALIRPQPQ